jgi:hypothetical protein
MKIEFSKLKIRDFPTSCKVINSIAPSKILGSAAGATAKSARILANQILINISEGHFPDTNVYNFIGILVSHSIFIMIFITDWSQGR